MLDFWTTTKILGACISIGVALDFVIAKYRVDIWLHAREIAFRISKLRFRDLHTKIAKKIIDTYEKRENRGKYEPLPSPPSHQNTIKTALNYTFYISEKYAELFCISVIWIIAAAIIVPIFFNSSILYNIVFGSYISYVITFVPIGIISYIFATLILRVKIIDKWMHPYKAKHKNFSAFVIVLMTSSLSFVISFLLGYSQLLDAILSLYPYYLEDCFYVAIYTLILNCLFDLLSIMVTYFCLKLVAIGKLYISIIALFTDVLFCVYLKYLLKTLLIDYFSSVLAYTYDIPSSDIKSIFAKDFETQILVDWMTFSILAPTIFVISIILFCALSKAILLFNRRFLLELIDRVADPDVDTEVKPFTALGVTIGICAWLIYAGQQIASAFYA